ncbi:protoporphyrinogen oxidase [Scleropages formosus]|uniref:Protoporphyrinogen oxidase n=1 Tax=Scleropages formosus TaxID=113540 RepID=A0A8C9SC49_SCLFO|nr:protoporphyrinogen oxidase [Scleropages formosus]
MQKTVVILGGGIGGLSTCFHLRKSPQVSKVVLLEASDRFGGWLSSTRREDGTVFEHGPRGVRPVGAAGWNTLNMVAELGLESEVLPVPYDHVASKNRFLFFKGKLHKMPSGLGGVFRTVPPFSRPLLQSVLKEIMVKRGKAEDETVHAFVERRLGAELADIAIDCLCRGVFAGDCRQLSMRSCFPPLFNAERARGSIVLGMVLGTGSRLHVPPSDLAKRSNKESWTQWSLKRGMQTLPEALQDALMCEKHVEVHKNVPVKGLTRAGSGWEIKLEDGAVKADHIISAIPAQALASVLPPAAKSLSQHLREIATVSVALVNLEYEGSILPVTGFGHLVPSSEDKALLGVVYDSVPFPQHSRPGAPSTRLTVMMGGAWFQEEFGKPEGLAEQELLGRATRAVRAHLGVTAEPQWSYVTVLKDCIPQYHLGHWKRLESIESSIKQHSLPLTLAGASYYGVSVNDVILSGRRAAESLVGKV